MPADHDDQRRYARLKPDLVEEGARRRAERDIQKLVRALAADGITASPDVAYAAWKRHSDEHEAGWLALYPDDADLRRALLNHLDLVEDADALRHEA